MLTTLGNKISIVTKVKVIKLTQIVDRLKEFGCELEE